MPAEIYFNFTILLLTTFFSVKAGFEQHINSALTSPFYIGCFFKTLLKQDLLLQLATLPGVLIKG